MDRNGRKAALPHVAPLAVAADRWGEMMQVEAAEGGNWDEQEFTSTFPSLWSANRMADPLGGTKLSTPELVVITVQLVPFGKPPQCPLPDDTLMHKQPCQPFYRHPVP